MPDAVFLDQTAKLVTLIGDESTQLSQAIVEVAEVVSVLVEGPQGPAGPTGSGDLHFTYSQASASASWTIVHNLGKYPSVTVVDSAGRIIEGDVSYDSLDQLTIQFSAPFGGEAYLN